MTIKVINMKVINCKNAEEITRMKYSLLRFPLQQSSYYHPSFIHEYTNRLMVECPDLSAAKRTL